MASTNPYARYVEGVDVIAALEETPRRLQALVAGWPREAFERSYAPGKWTARQVLAHLAQIERVFASRLRFGLTVTDYVVQPFDQDDWMAVDEGVDAESALTTYLALRRMNVAVCRRLTPGQRTRPFTHPERGAIDVDWLMAMFAGHERHHLAQLEVIAAPV
jgi:uncharacterized damage-inducible protein DinB